MTLPSGASDPALVHDHGQGPDPEHRPAAPAATIPAKALTSLLLIALMATLYIGKALFLPVIIAMLLSFLFAPAVRWLHDIGLPRVLGAMMVLLLAGGAIGVGAYELSTPASEWMERLPEALEKVKRKLVAFKDPVDRVKEAAKQVDSLTTGTDAGHPVVSVSAPSTLASHVMNSTGEFLAATLITTITLFFLLASGGTILDRLVALIPALRSDHDPSKILLGTQPELDSTMVLRESERLVGMFLRTTILINAALGAVLSVAFWAVGMPSPVLWGVLAGILNFLPYIGPIIGVPIVALAALATFDNNAAAIVPPLIYAVCACIEGNMITPYILGKRLAMSPIAIFLWMALWGWMWGAAGALIAVPLLVMAKEFCSRIEEFKRLARIIEP